MYVRTYVRCIIRKIVSQRILNISIMLIIVCVYISNCVNQQVNMLFTFPKFLTDFEMEINTGGS